MVNYILIWSDIIQATVGWGQSSRSSDLHWGISYKEGSISTHHSNFCWILRTETTRDICTSSDGSEKGETISPEQSSFMSLCFTQRPSLKIFQSWKQARESQYIVPDRREWKENHLASVRVYSRSRQNFSERSDSKYFRFCRL